VFSIAALARRGSASPRVMKGSRMNAQGVSGVTTADVPEILAQQPGTAAPISVTGENGAVVPQSTLTALFDQNGNYVGSYGIDPSTGAFSAWNAQGLETSFQAFAAEHQLANGATPFASDGGNAVLYNASGQVIGLDVAGYVVDKGDMAQNTTGPGLDGDITVYDETGQNALGTFGYSAADGYFLVNGSDANTFLEQEGGFTAAQLSQAAQSLQTNGDWDPSNATDAAVRQVLIEEVIAQNTNSLATVTTGVYDANGNYLGAFGVSANSYVVFDQDGITNNTTVYQDDGITVADQFDAAQLLTLTTPIVASDYTNLRQINAALSAYMLSQAASQPLTSSVDIYDNGEFSGAVGIDSQTGQLAVEETNGVILDVDSALLSQYGLSASQLSEGQQSWAAPTSTPLTYAQSLNLSETSSALGSLLENAGSNPFGAMTPAQVAKLTPQQLASYSASEIEGLTAAQINALSTTQIQAVNAGGFSAAALAGLSANSVKAFSNAQLAVLDDQQLQALAPAEVAVLSPTQLAAFSAAQVGALSAAQISALSTAQIQAISDTGLSSEVLSGLSPSSFAALSNAQLTVLDVQQLRALTPAELAALSAAQFAAFAPAQLAELSNAQVGALSAAQINALSALQIQALNVSALGEAPLAGLSESAVQSFSQDQIEGLSESQVDWLGDAVQWFTSQQVQDLSSTQMQALTASQLTVFSAAQLSSLAATQLAALLPEQIATFTGSQTASFDGAQLSLLNTAQIDAVGRGQLVSLAESQLGVVSTATNGPILTPNPGWQPYGVPTVTSDGTNTTTTNQMWNTLTNTLCTTTAVNGQVTQFCWVTYADGAGPSTDNPQIIGTTTQTDGPNGSYTDVSTNENGQISFINVTLPYIPGTTTSAGGAQFVVDGPTATAQLTGPGGTQLGTVTITVTSNLATQMGNGLDVGSTIANAVEPGVTPSITSYGIIFGAIGAFAAGSDSTYTVVFNTNAITGSMTLAPDPNLAQLGIGAAVDVSGNLQFSNGDAWTATSVLGFETQIYTTADGTVFTETDGCPTTAVTPDGSEWVLGSDGNFQYSGPAGSAPPGAAPSPTGSPSASPQPPDGQAAPLLPAFLGGPGPVVGSSNSGTTSASNSGTTSGSGSGATSGSDSGTTSGGDSGTTSGTDSGTTSGTDSGTTSGTDSGTTSGSNSGTTPASSSGSGSSGSTSGSSSGSGNSGTTSGSSSGSTSGSSSGSGSSGSTSGSSSGSGNSGTTSASSSGSTSGSSSGSGNSGTTSASSSGSTSGSSSGSGTSGTTSGSGSGTTSGGGSGTPSTYTVTSAGSGTISGDENAGANGADGGTSTNGTTSGTHGGAPGGKPL
jgi:hypothetical protein